MPPATFTAASTLTKRYDFPLTPNSVGVRSAPSAQRRRDLKPAATLGQVEIAGEGQSVAVRLESNMSRGRPGDRSARPGRCRFGCGARLRGDAQGRQAARTAHQDARLIGGEGSSMWRAASNPQSSSVATLRDAEIDRANRVIVRVGDVERVAGDRQAARLVEAGREGRDLSGRQDRAP